MEAGITIKLLAVEYNEQGTDSIDEFMLVYTTHQDEYTCLRYGKNSQTMKLLGGSGLKPITPTYQAFEKFFLHPDYSGVFSNTFEVHCL